MANDKWQMTILNVLEAKLNIYIYNTPLSYVTELFNLFKPSFLLIPIKIHLKVTSFALNIAIFLKNKSSLINHDIYYKHVLQI